MAGPYPADPMAAVLAHDGVALTLDVALDRMSEVAQAIARGHLPDATPHGLESYVAKSPCLDRGLADREHAARVAVEAVLDDGHVDIEYVSRLQDPIAGNAVADHVVH